MAKGRRALAVLLLGALEVAPVLAAAQAFPGEAPRPPAFPTALSAWVMVGWAGQRSTRTYRVGPLDPPDPACDTNFNCHTEHLLTGTPGLGARFQTSLTVRTGIRFGLSISGPKRKLGGRKGLTVAIDTARLNLLRGEALFLFRLKQHVPVFFGVGGALARFSPGPVRSQDDVTEYGGALAVGYDHRGKGNVGTRVEWTVYLMRPVTTGLSGEYKPPRLAFDHQLSFGVNYFVGP